MIELGRHNIVGVSIDAVDYEAAVGRIVQAAQERKPLAVSALAVHGVMTGVEDAEHRHRLNQLDLVVPDGQPVRWALRWLHGVRLADRVYGPQLMLETCRAAAEKELPIYLFGATEEMLAGLQENLSKQFPKLQIAGCQSSRFRRLDTEEWDQLAEQIKQSGAAITMVGLGCPRQEVWAYEMRDRLQMPTLAVGAAFAFHAGMLSQAPAWLQRRGLEWSYRLAMEPRRLWHRYLVLSPRYLAAVAMQRLGLRDYATHDNCPPSEMLRYG